MNVRQVVFSVPQGIQATLAFPEPVTEETIEMLEQASALMLRSLRCNAGRQDSSAAGEIEYASWAPNARAPR